LRATCGRAPNSGSGWRRALISRPRAATATSSYLPVNRLAQGAILAEHITNQRARCRATTMGRPGRQVTNTHAAASLRQADEILELIVSVHHSWSLLDVRGARRRGLRRRFKVAGSHPSHCGLSHEVELHVGPRAAQKIVLKATDSPSGEQRAAGQRTQGGRAVARNTIASAISSGAAGGPAGACAGNGRLPATARAPIRPVDKWHRRVHSAR